MEERAVVGVVGGVVGAGGVGAASGNGIQSLCQGQFAVNGPLHLAALSLRGCMLPGASLHCMLGGARPLQRQKYIRHYYVNSGE